MRSAKGCIKAAPRDVFPSFLNQRRINSSVPVHHHRQHSKLQSETLGQRTVLSKVPTSHHSLSLPEICDDVVKLYHSYESSLRFIPLDMVLHLVSSSHKNIGQ